MPPMMPMRRWPCLYRYSIIRSDAAISSTDTLERLAMRSVAALLVSSRQGMPKSSRSGVKYSRFDPRNRMP